MSTLTSTSSTPNDSRAAFWLALLMATIPGIVWWQSVGNLGAYFSHQVPQGQLLYLFSKLSGLYAYFLMALQVVIGMQGRRSRYFAMHPSIGALTTIAVIAHVGLFIGAASVRAGHFASDNLVPDFGHGYFKTSVSLGIIAAYCLLPVLAAGIWLKRSSPAFFLVHRLAFVVAALGWLHSIRIGTETRSPIIMAFYVSLLIWVGCFLLIRLWTSIRARRARFFPGH